MNKTLYRILIVICSLGILVSGWSLFSYYHEGHKTRDRYEDLAAAVQQARPSEAAAETGTAPDATAETKPEDGILPEYRELLAYNRDLVGWLVIEGTEINYPVVQTPEEPEYYIDRDFDGEENPHGCLFAEGGCNVETSDNVTIYGHHMKDGTMFADLMNYTKASFWKDHPSIRFDTLTEHRRYEIFAVFRTTATVGQGFPYHRFVDAADAAEFDQYVEHCRNLSLYDTGVLPEFGDKLICLSTCEYSQHNGRFVVVGVYRPQ